MFDQSNQPQWFRLDSVIDGWRSALPQMPTGAKWRLVIPSAQAYGADGAGDLIAPYTPLVFEIELLGTAMTQTKNGAPCAPFFESADEYSGLSRSLFLVGGVQHFDQAVFQLETLVQQTAQLLEFLRNTLALRHKDH